MGQTLSAHYVINTDGQIVKMVQDTEAAHHAGVSFWGGVKLLHSVNQFFDRVLYLGLVGYQKAGASDRASMHATSG